jgi:hypothetical protein
MLIVVIFLFVKILANIFFALYKLSTTGFEPATTRLKARGNHILQLKAYKLDTPFKLEHKPNVISRLLPYRNDDDKFPNRDLHINVMLLSYLLIATRW